MAAIKSKNTKPEKRLRRLLHRQGLRFRINSKKLPGKPDVVLKKHQCVVFVHGCFWHGHENCKHFRLPKTRTEWWGQKISATKNRDKIKKRELEAIGWRVITV